MKPVTYWKDLAGTIPAQNGDPVALVRNAVIENGECKDMIQPVEHLRPTITFQGALANTKPMGDNWSKK